jgi:hypothetical protein
MVAYRVHGYKQMRNLSDFYKVRRYVDESYLVSGIKYVLHIICQKLCPSSIRGQLVLEKIKLNTYKIRVPFRDRDVAIVFKRPRGPFSYPRKKGYEYYDNSGTNPIKIVDPNIISWLINKDETKEKDK